MSEEVEVSLRDEIAAAFKDTQEGEVVKEQNDLKRDETGRFAKKEEAKDDKVADKTVKPEGTKPEVKDPATDAPKQENQEGQAGSEKEQPQKILVQDKAPQSWTPKSRERWADIPEDIRQEILRREEAAVVGVRQLQESFAPARQFIDTLGSFIQEASQSNVDPGQYISQVMNAERGLRSGTAEQRFAALVGIADSYGIPLRQALTEALGKDVLPPPTQQLPAHVQKELDEARQFRQQYQQQQKKEEPEDAPEIVAFAKDHEFFNDVRMEMANVLEAGLATDMESAYKEACFRVPGVRELLAERAAQGDQRQQRQQVAAKVGKTTSSNGVVTGVENEHDDSDDIRETVRKAAAAAANNRV